MSEIKHKPKKLSILNRFILLTFATVTIVFILMISFVTHFLFTKRIDNEMIADAENARAVRISLSKNFEDMTRWLWLAQNNLSALDFNSSDNSAAAIDDEAAENIVNTLMGLNTNIYSMWYVIDKDAYGNIGNGSYQSDSGNSGN